METTKTDTPPTPRAERAIDWRTMNKVPLEVRRDVLRAVLELRRDRATAALKALDACEALETAGCASADGAFFAAQGAHADYSLDDAFNVSINEVYEDELSEGTDWAVHIRAELEAAAQIRVAHEELPPAAPAPATTPAITTEEMPF